jgi:endoglycosylceramidase
MGGLRRGVVVAAAAGAAAAAAAAAPASPCDPDAAPLRVDAGTGAFVDACGRFRVFRGTNVVSKSAPYYPPSVFSPGGWTASPTDAALWRSLGWNGLRLGHMWSGAVPAARGVVNTTYTGLLANLSSALYTGYGVYTLVDKHQDVFSLSTCGDGAPQWLGAEYTTGATAGFPAPLGLGFQTLYTTEKGWADAGDFWAGVIAAYGASPARGRSILAYELLNEPWAGDVLADPLNILPSVADATLLQPYAFNVTARVRAAEAAAGLQPHVMSVEPVTWDEFVPAGFTALPGAADGLAALSHHYYSVPDIVGSAWEVAARAADARRLGAAGILSEFDIDLLSPVEAPYTNLDLRATLDAVDAVRHSYFGWAYASIWNNSQIHVPAVREMARPFPAAVAAAAGTNVSYVFNATAPAWTLEYTHDAAVGAAAPTEVYLPTGLWFSPASAMVVSVVSTPPGAVTWATAPSPGQAPAPGVTSVPPTPFAFATLTITTAAGAPATAAVTVTVTMGA